MHGITPVPSGNAFTRAPGTNTGMYLPYLLSKCLHTWVSQLLTTFTTQGNNSQHQNQINYLLQKNYCGTKTPTSFQKSHLLPLPPSQGYASTAENSFRNPFPLNCVTLTPDAVYVAYAVPPV